MAGNVIDLTDATFDETVHNSDVPVLVDFWAPWCGPCKMLTPLIKEIANDYQDKAKICKLNTDEARDSAVEFGINAIPTTILFKDGQVQKKWVGLTSKKDLQQEGPYPGHRRAALKADATALLVPSLNSLEGCHAERSEASGQRERSQHRNRRDVRWPDPSLRSG